MTKAAPAPGIADDTLFDLRYARSHDDLWGMLTRLYGAHPGFAGFRKALDKALRETTVAFLVEYLK